jgi:hypothetical protein
MIISAQIHDARLARTHQAGRISDWIGHWLERKIPQIMQPSNSRYRWIMLGLIWILYFVFGLFTRSMAPLVTPVLKDLNISFAEMGFILGSWQLTYIFSPLPMEQSLTAGVSGNRS